jgi:outer membrane protein TolC
VEVLSKSVELAEKSYNISKSRFDAGTITSFDLSQMQLRLTDARTNSLYALIDYKLAVADLTRKTLFNFEKQ